MCSGSSFIQLTETSVSLMSLLIARSRESVCMDGERGGGGDWVGLRTD